LTFWQKINNRKHNKIVEQYIEAGTELGDACSYLPIMGKCDQYNDLLDEWVRTENLYAALGYRTIPLSEFMDAGGYGKNIDHLIKVKREALELPIFHGCKEKDLEKQRFYEVKEDGTLVRHEFSDEDDNLLDMEKNNG
jgi:hypothetical protein